MAVPAARRRGLGDPRWLEVKTSALIGACIWRRAAAMVLACMPSAARRDAVMQQMTHTNDYTFCVRLCSRCLILMTLYFLCPTLHHSSAPDYAASALASALATCTRTARRCLRKPSTCSALHARGVASVNS